MLVEFLGMSGTRRVEEGSRDTNGRLYVEGAHVQTSGGRVNKSPRAVLSGVPCVVLRHNVPSPDEQYLE
jgi:hypothetical protein